MLSRGSLTFGSCLIASAPVFVLLLFPSRLTVTVSGEGNDGIPSKEMVTKEDIQNYFAIKRKQHLEAVQTLLKFQRYEQKYEMMRRIFEKIFEVLESSRSKVENSNYVLGDELPRNEVIEHVLYVLDNCAFFGNLVLKLPDISERLLKLNNQWVDSYKWCFTFSTNSNLIDEYSLKMFDLAAQQLNLVPKSKDFVNPYEEKRAKKTDSKNNLADSKFASGKAAANNKKKSQTQTKKIKSGPKMSRVDL